MTDLVIGAIACPAYARSGATNPVVQLDENVQSASHTFEELRTRAPRRPVEPRFPVAVEDLGKPETVGDPAWLPALLAALAEHYAVPIPVFIAAWAVDYGPDVDADAYRDVVRAYLTFVEG